MQNLPHRLKAGDVIQMGYKKRSFIQWLLRKPKEPQLWRISYEARINDVIFPITPIEDNNLDVENHGV